jgi:hypothetical protein
LFSYGILANIIVFGNALDAENKINEAWVLYPKSYRLATRCC